jgi:hypothetical protein
LYAEASIRSRSASAPATKVTGCAQNEKNNTGKVWTCAKIHSFPNLDVWAVNLQPLERWFTSGETSRPRARDACDSKKEAIKWIALHSKT